MFNGIKAFRFRTTRDARGRWEINPILVSYTVRPSVSGRNYFYTYFGPISSQPAEIVRTNTSNGFWGFKSLQEGLEQLILGADNPYLGAYAEVTHFGKVIEYAYIYRSSKLRIDKIYMYQQYFRRNPEADPNRFIKNLEERYQCEVSLK